MSFTCFHSYRWIRFEVCRAGDGQIPNSLSEDDASVNFEAYQRHRCFTEKIKTEPIPGCLNVVAHIRSIVVYAMTVECCYGGPFYICMYKKNILQQRECIKADACI